MAHCIRQVAEQFNSNCLLNQKWVALVMVWKRLAESPPTQWWEMEIDQIHTGEVVDYKSERFSSLIRLGELMTILEMYFSFGARSFSIWVLYSRFSSRHRAPYFEFLFQSKQQVNRWNGRNYHAPSDIHWRWTTAVSLPPEKSADSKCRATGELIALSEIMMIHKQLNLIVSGWYAPTGECMGNINFVPPVTWYSSTKNEFAEIHSDSVWKTSWSFKQKHFQWTDGAVIFQIWTCNWCVLW